ncbi:MULTISPECIES: universal stress protein [unclassified Haloferax]|uniref:universal stress protein n=1 Tax=unclassified Haloferax TaxID=2625095 RepID=UPI0002B026F2|nr:MULTISPECIES: universal stress protein [unclassified Haloferax]ELZ59092.1 uspA domain protein [Haloferax sp. ATCC BAA-646]ELZ60383.1 uspA domain protein [Haloferax sp. ATCC BAA-645]ELZ72306.1 uspA domain protein [Haloferax sp. ATCC BAA-644]
MYEHILVPTDGSDAAEYAVEQAVDIASKYGATVHALYVVDVDATSYSLGTEQVDRIRQGHLDDMPEVKEAADAATGYVADAAAEHGLAVREHVVPGEPARAIRKFVEDNDIDLVVMGSHGRSGLSRVVLGSVTERVLRRTRLPVLVVDVHEKKAEPDAEADA